MSRGSGSGGNSRGRGNSRRHSRSQRNHRANQKNPNNAANKSARDNRANQMNPNNSAHSSSRSSGSSGSWRRRMDSDSASRIQSHADKTGRNQDFKSRAQSAAERNEDDDEK